MNLIYYPDPILQRKCDFIEKIDNSIKEISSEMFKIMYEHRGIGLAAPQVGLSLQLFITNLSCNPEDKTSEKIYINPEITSATGHYISSEGCLSFPNIFADIRRSFKITFRSMTIDGDVIEGELEDLPARVFQHEVDHLNGILIVKKMSHADRIKFSAELKALEAAYHKKSKAQAIK